MLKNIRTRLARSLASDYLSNIDKQIQVEVDARAAKFIASIDPFQILMKEFHGVFSDEFEHPEDRLDAKGKLGMMMWGYQQENDLHFKHMTEWIMNTQGNETLKRAPVTTDRILYGRAQISTMLLFIKEIRRLSNQYKELLARQKEGDFDKNLTVEE